jgi:hypothetical protein
MTNDPTTEIMTMSDEDLLDNYESHIENGRDDAAQACRDEILQRMAVTA